MSLRDEIEVNRARISEIQAREREKELSINPTSDLITEGFYNPQQRKRWAESDHRILTASRKFLDEYGLPKYFLKRCFRAYKSELSYRLSNSHGFVNEGNHIVGLYYKPGDNFESEFLETCFSTPILVPKRQTNQSWFNVLDAVKYLQDPDATTIHYSIIGTFDIIEPAVSGFLTLMLSNPNLSLPFSVGK